MQKKLWCCATVKITAILGGYFLRIHSISVMEGQKNPLLILRLLYGSSLGGYTSISSEILTK